MKSLSTAIILTLLAGALVSVPGGIRAQQSSASTQQLSERLLDAVGGNDIEAIQSILAIAAGRALVATPIGLTAAGRAIERGYYEVAHQILAVRTQQIQLEKKVEPVNPYTETASGAAKPRQSTSPANQLRRTSPPAVLGSPIPGPLGVIVPTPATKPTPKAAARTEPPTTEPPPPLSGPNPFDSSHTPEVELPRVVPVGQPDSRSDRLDTFPVARVAPPPDLPLRGLLKNKEPDSAPARNLPTPINALAGLPEAKKTGFFSRLLDTVYGAYNPFHSQPVTGMENPGKHENVSAPDPSYRRGEPPTAPSINAPTLETVNFTKDEPPSDGILSRWTRFISSGDPAETPYPAVNSVSDPLATARAPEPTKSASKVKAKDWPPPNSELTEPVKAASPPEEFLSSDPEEPGFIDLIKKVLRWDTTQPGLAREETSVSPTTVAKPLDHSLLGPSEITNLTHRRNEQAKTRVISSSYPLHDKAPASEPEKLASAVRILPVSPSPGDRTMPPTYIGAEIKSNPFHKKTIQLPTLPAPASTKSTPKIPGKYAMFQPKKPAAAIRSGSTRNEPAAIATVRAQKPEARKKTARLIANADNSGNARETPPIFRIGGSLTLGRSINPKALASRQCFQKERDTSWFCLEHADWPLQMTRDIGKSIDRYRVAATVVQYKNRKAIRIYSSIPSDSYEDAVEYYSNLIGPATEVSVGKLARLGNTPLPNPASTWVNTLSNGGSEILEIRKFDNIRGLMASETTGLIRLFKENSDPIFSILSDTDLILHQLRAQNTK